MCCPFLRLTSHETMRGVRFGLYRCSQSETHLSGEGGATRHVSVARVSPVHPRFEAWTDRKFIRSLPQKVILNCMGIRAEESNPRVQLSPLTFNQSLSTQQRTVYNWLPIFDRTLSDVLAWHWVNAIRLHPVYVPEHHDDGAKDGYLRRLSCRVRIFATDADLAAISLHDRPASSGSLNSNGN